MQFTWTTNDEGIHVCNIDEARVQVQEDGTYKATVFDATGFRIAEIPFSTLGMAKQAVEIHLEKLAAAGKL